MVFLVEKPTTAAKLEKKLEKSDIPEVVVCMEPGFNHLTLKTVGYRVNTYYRGALQPYSSFIGWNGDTNANKSSHEILEEALLLPKSEALVLVPHIQTYTDIYRITKKLL